MNIYQIKKFKTITIKIKFSEQLKKENATIRAVLSNVILRGSKNYPDQKIINDELDYAYGADINTQIIKKGMISQFDITLSFVHPNYIKDQDYLKRLLELFNDLILNPIQNEKYLKQEIEEIKFELESMYDDKMAYASLKSNELTDPNKTFSVSTSGYLEDLNIDLKQLQQYYESLFKTNNIDIYIVGEIDEKIEKEIKNLIQIKEITNFKTNNSITLNEEIKTKNEIQNIEQAKMHLVFDINTTFASDDYAKVQVFNDLMGGYSHSLFFTNIREKHSLAYYIASRYNSFLGLIYVYSGINVDNYQQTKKLIFEQITNLQNGNFEISDLDKTKNMIVNSLKESLDTQSSYINFANTFKMYNNNWNFEKIIEKTYEVTKEDIMEIAKKMNLKSIYLLSNKEIGAL